MFDLLSPELLSLVLEQLSPQGRRAARQACKRLDAASRTRVTSIVLKPDIGGAPDWSRFPAITTVAISGYDTLDGRAEVARQQLLAIQACFTPTTAAMVERCLHALAAVTRLEFRCYADAGTLAVALQRMPNVSALIIGEDGPEMDMATAMAIRGGAQQLEQLSTCTISVHTATALAGLPSLRSLRITSLAQSGGDGGLAAWAALPLGQLTRLGLGPVPPDADLGALTQVQVLASAQYLPLQLPATASLGALSQLRDLRSIELPFDRVQLLADSLPHLQVLVAHLLGEWGPVRAAFNRVTHAYLHSNMLLRLPVSGVVQLAQLLPAVVRLGVADYGDARFFYDLSGLTGVEALHCSLSNEASLRTVAMPRLSQLSCNLDHSDPPGFPAGFPDFSRLTALEVLDLKVRANLDDGPLDFGPYMCAAARAPRLRSILLIANEEAGDISYGSIVRLGREATALRRLALLNVGVDAQQFAALGMLPHLQLLQVHAGGELLPEGDWGILQRLAGEIEAAGGPVVVFDDLDGNLKEDPIVIIPAADDGVWW